MWNKIKFLGIIIAEQYQQILAARRESEIERQEVFVAQLGSAYEEHEFPDYKERYEREAEKLFWMKTIHEGMTAQVTRHNNIQRI